MCATSAPGHQDRHRYECVTKQVTCPVTRTRCVPTCETVTCTVNVKKCVPYQATRW